MTARLLPALGIFVLMSALGLALLPTTPATDDARFYIPAAAQQARWLEGVLSGNLDLLGPEGVRAAFASNAEHPPLGKLLMGAGWWLLHHRTGWLSELTAARVPVVLLWALTGAVLFAWTRRYLHPVAAASAALSLTAIPRVLFHGRVETLDWPVAGLCLLSGAALFACLERPSFKRGALAVVLYALALGTKLNAPFLLVSATLYWLLSPLRTSSPRKSSPRKSSPWTSPPSYSPPPNAPPHNSPPQRSRPQPASARSPECTFTLPPVPGVLLGWLLIAPLITWALWPWLWYDTTARLQSYLQFHLQHYPILFYFGGHLYHREVAPVYAPWVMLALTTPLPITLLAAVGTYPPVRAVLGMLPGLRRSLGSGTAELLRNPRVRLGLFAALMGGVQLLAVSLPGVAKYGGVKLFMPLFPFMAVLFALGLDRAITQMRAPSSARTRTLAAAAALGLLLLPGWLGSTLYKDAPLSYYAGWPGGVAGATLAGYERQYYDLAYPRMAQIIAAELPQGGPVAFLPNPKEYRPYLLRWQAEGRISPRVTLAAPQEAHLLFVTHERRWREYPLLYDRHRLRPVHTVYEIAGVPLFTVFGRAD